MPGGGRERYPTDTGLDCTGMVGQEERPAGALPPPRRSWASLQLTSRLRCWPGVGSRNPTAQPPAQRLILRGQTLRTRSRSDRVSRPVSKRTSSCVIESACIFRYGSRGTDTNSVGIAVVRPQVPARRACGGGCPERDRRLEAPRSRPGSAAASTSGSEPSRACSQRGPGKARGRRWDPPCQAPARPLAA